MPIIYHIHRPVSLAFAKINKNTFDNNNPWYWPSLTKDQRNKGYYCYQWAYAFEDAFNHESSGKYFTVKVEEASDSARHVHFWIVITSKCDPKNQFMSMTVLLIPMVTTYITRGPSLTTPIIPGPLARRGMCQRTRLPFRQCMTPMVTKFICLVTVVARTTVCRPRSLARTPLTTWRRPLNR